ncbi:MAG: ATP diphosphatase [Glaciecola sp.]|jgi:ATP diphosphatase
MSQGDKLKSMKQDEISLIDSDDMRSLESEDALQRSLDIQLACAKVGFDWPEVHPVFEKVLEEVDEVKDEVYNDQPEPAKIEDELGDLLFAVVNLCRHLDVHPETALNNASDKFVHRFELVKSFALNENLVLEKLNIDELELLWQKAKKHIIE